MPTCKFSYDYLMTQLEGFFYYFIFDFREIGREGEREDKKLWCERKHQLPSALAPGDGTCNPGMCPTGNRTGDLLVHWAVPNQLSYTSWGPVRVPKK